jgi:hypothetical protein
MNLWLEGKGKEGYRDTYNFFTKEMEVKQV